uniref:Uncharacterized protein n=1 Tax=Arundo donax TaxID=35708 RepID=A0A0A9B4V1_ARUDO
MILSFFISIMVSFLVYHKYHKDIIGKN